MVMAEEAGFYEPVSAENFGLQSLLSAHTPVIFHFLPRLGAARDEFANKQWAARGFVSRKALQITGTELERKSRDQVWIRFTEEQIIAVLREHEAGAKAGDLARKHGISEATLYNWKAKHGGMDVSDAKRLRSLEDENRKLKKLLAESMLDQTALKELLTKNGNARRQARGYACRRPLFRNSQALGTSTLDSPSLSSWFNRKVMPNAQVYAFRGIASPFR